MVYFKTPDNDPVISLHFADPRFLFLGDVNGEIHIVDIRHIQFTEKEIFVDFKPPPPPVPGEENGAHEEIATGNGEHPSAITTAGAGDLQAVNEQSPAAGGSGSLHAVSEQPLAGISAQQEGCQQPVAKTVNLQAGSQHEQSPGINSDLQTNSGLPVVVQPLMERTAALQADCQEPPVAETASLQADCHEPTVAETAGLQADCQEPTVAETAALQADCHEPLVAETASLQADCHEPPVAQTAGLQADFHQPPAAETAGLQADCHQPPAAETASLQADSHEPPAAETAGLQADCHEPPVAETADLQAGCRLVRTLRSHAYSAFIWSIQSDGMRKEKIRFLFPIAYYKRTSCRN